MQKEKQEKVIGNESRHKSLDISKWLLLIGVGPRNACIYAGFLFLCFIFQEVLINFILNAKTCARLMSALMLNKKSLSLGNSLIEKIRL